MTGSGTGVRRTRREGAGGGIGWFRSGRALARSAAALAVAIGIHACGDEGVAPPPVDPPRATTVTVIPATATLDALDATVRFAAEVRDQNGRVMAGAAVTWTSGSTSVAAVDGTGLARAVGNGTATITARAGSASGSAMLTVDQVVTALHVSPSADTVLTGDTLRLSAAAVDANGNEVAGVAFEWMSSDTLVARVDGAGLVTGVAAGGAEITATGAKAGEAESSGAAALAIVDPAPTTVMVSIDTLAFDAIGEEARLAAEVHDQAGRVMEDAVVSWSSADTAVALVNASGLVTATGGGTAAVSAMAGDAEGVTVVMVVQSADSVVVSPASHRIAPGDTLSLRGEAFDRNDHPIPDPDFAWASSDTLVATVDASGLVRGTGEGAAAVTATADGTSGSATVTVVEVIASVSVSPSADTIVTGDTLRLTAEAFLADGRSLPGIEFTWTTSDSPVATVDDSGLVTGTGEGKVTITATETVDGDARGMAEITVQHPDWAALAALFQATQGGNWVNKRNWVSDEPLRRWYGVGADVSGRVVSLSLRENRLFGPIPPDLGNLTDLAFLFLGLNRLSGPIPTELARLGNLQQLRLGSNALSGAIPPELGRLTHLEGLRLGDNALSATIPPELGNLSELQELRLHGNSLSGPIPAELGNLTALKQLLLYDNDLSGSIPPALGSLVNLEDLRLSGNSLSGPIPPALGYLTELKVLYLHGNDLSGPIPPELGNLTALESLPLYESSLSGPIPAELGNLTNLRQLHLDGNDLSGPIPPELGNLTELGKGFSSPTHPTHRSSNWCGWADLDLSDNALSGPIPAELGELANIAKVDLSGNQLSGSIPPELGSLGWRYQHGYCVLDLSNNELSGPIPSRLWRAATRVADLSNNNLTGPIPSSGYHLGYWKLNLSNNNLSGPIPPRIGGWQRTSSQENGELDLSNNNLSGPIPPGIGRPLDSRSYNSRRVLNLSNNNLSGVVPPELGNMLSLNHLYLAGNPELSGPLPAEMTKLTNLKTLTTAGTKVCAPQTPGFVEWLANIDHDGVPSC